MNGAGPAHVAAGPAGGFGGVVPPGQVEGSDGEVPQVAMARGCHHARFPRTRAGLERLRKALVVLAADPPTGLGEYPVIWWLADASS
jgi:hypothetical protein